MYTDMPSEKAASEWTEHIVADNCYKSELSFLLFLQDRNLIDYLQKYNGDNLEGG